MVSLEGPNPVGVFGGREVAGQQASLQVANGLHVEIVEALPQVGRAVLGAGFQAVPAQFFKDRAGPGLVHGIPLGLATPSAAAGFSDRE